MNWRYRSDEVNTEEFGPVPHVSLDCNLVPGHFLTVVFIIVSNLRLLFLQLSLKTRAMDVVMGVQSMYEAILHN